MLVAAARDTFGMMLESMLGSVLELVLELILAPVLGSCFIGFGNHVGLVLGTFKLSLKRTTGGEGIVCDMILRPKLCSPLQPQQLFDANEHPNRHP